jgi:hypothetical protein
MTNGQYWAVLIGMLLCANITAWLDAPRGLRSWRLVWLAVRLVVLGVALGVALLAFLNRLTTTSGNYINSPAFNSSDSVFGLLLVVFVAAFVVGLVNMVTSVWRAIRHHASRG